MGKRPKMACDFLNDFEAPTKGRTKKLLKNWSNAEGFFNCLQIVIIPTLNKTA